MSYKITALFSALSKPHPSVTASEEQLKARLLSLLLLIGILALIVGYVVTSLWTQADADWLIPIALALAIIYGLSRSRYYHAAAVLGIFLFGYPAYHNLFALAEHNTYTIFFALAWLVFPVLLASLVLSVRATIVTAAVVMAGVGLLLLFSTAVDVNGVVSPVAYIAAATGMIAAATVVRENYSAQLKTSLAQLKETKIALEHAHKELEQRVEARTAELQESNQRLSQEITDRENTERELSLARDQALEALKVKARILANVSHDARTPLSIISLRTEMMQRGMHGELNEKQREALNSILVSTKDLLDFVDNLLQESQLSTTRKMRPGKIEMIPAVWLEGLAETFRLVADQKKLKLRVQIDNVPQIVVSDPAWLRHIMNNLINNAIKFTEKGTVTLRAFQPDADHWAMEVIDTGIGISEEAQRHIYEPFWQVDGSTTRQVARGIGLGLSIVHNLTHLMEGRIELTSKPGEGSTFTVILPLQTETDDDSDT